MESSLAEIIKSSKSIDTDCSGAGERVGAGATGVAGGRVVTVVGVTVFLLFPNDA